MLYTGIHQATTAALLLPGHQGPRRPACLPGRLAQGAAQVALSHQPGAAARSQEEGCHK